MIYYFAGDSDLCVCVCLLPGVCLTAAALASPLPHYISLDTSLDQTAAPHNLGQYTVYAFFEVVEYLPMNYFGYSIDPPFFFSLWFSVQTSNTTFFCKIISIILHIVLL